MVIGSPKLMETHFHSHVSTLSLSKWSFLTKHSISPKLTPSYTPALKSLVRFVHKHVGAKILLIANSKLLFWNTARKKNDVILASRSGRISIKRLKTVFKVDELQKYLRVKVSFSWNFLSTVLYGNYKKFWITYGTIFLFSAYNHHSCWASPTLFGHHVFFMIRWIKWELEMFLYRR